MGTLGSKSVAFGRFDVRKENGEYSTEISIDDIPSSILKRFNIKEGDELCIDLFKDGSVGIMKA